MEWHRTPIMYRKDTGRVKNPTKPPKFGPRTPPVSTNWGICISALRYGWREVARDTTFLDRTTDREKDSPKSGRLRGGFKSALAP